MYEKQYPTNRVSAATNTTYILVECGNHGPIAGNPELVPRKSVERDRGRRVRVDVERAPRQLAHANP